LGRVRSGPTRPVPAGPGPVDLVSFRQAVEEQSVQLVPHSRLLPIAQPSPAGHATAAAPLLGQVLPLEARLQDEEDPRERLPIRPRRASALGLGPLRRPQRLDDLPQFIRYPRLRHTRSLSQQLTVLLGALKSCRSCSYLPERSRPHRRKSGRS
jgi:hypothetical protein